MDPLKYIFQKAMPTEKLAKWLMLLSEFDIVYVTHKCMNSSRLVFPMKRYRLWVKIFLKHTPGWRVFFDGATNHQGRGIGESLVSESVQHYPVASKLLFNSMNIMVEYETCILRFKMSIDMNVHKLVVIGDLHLLIDQVQGEWVMKTPKITPYVQYIQKLCKRFCKIEFRHTSRMQNELDDALATIASMIKHLDPDYIDPLDIEIKQHQVHCSHVESQPDGLP
ncbi:uncharacterized protein LOC107006512 [Solanum pennellii]|uniref:Uncharacterized protein LOC107006512 n=1 Tax=Solanum pennellii TaxID=28526 RepID=A0ABM1FR46_SOLPN|nr:uncharacterized protein LOC107006512 [Solanum pennellii]